MMETAHAPSHRGDPPVFCRRRHRRVAARWLLRYLEEDDEATIDELAFAASCLAALTGNDYPEAAQALRDMTKKATRRRRGRGVA